MAKNYGDTSIKTLDPVTHIRTRPGMYVGEPGTGAMYHDCIYILMKEVIDNSIDEFVMGEGKRIDVTVDYDTGETSVRDYGRGIPLGKVVDCVSQMNTGGKFDSDSFQFSAGMNGVGTKAVNALSEFFEVRSFRDGEFSEAYFEEGRIKSKKRGKAKTSDGHGTYTRYKPDAKVLKHFKVREEHVLRRMRMYCYVNAGLTIKLNGQEIRSDGGLSDLISDEAQFEKLYQPFHVKTKNLEIIFTHTNRFGEEYHTFVNGQYTTDGGTHLTAFKEAEAHNGPSIIIAYAPCMLHGINMSKSQVEQKRAVEAGYWPLYRFNPALEAPFIWETKDASGSYQDFIRSENRYKQLLKAAPAEAEALFTRAEEDAARRMEFYKKIGEVMK